MKNAFVQKLLCWNVGHNAILIKVQRLAEISLRTAIDRRKAMKHQIFMKTSEERAAKYFEEANFLKEIKNTLTKGEMIPLRLGSSLP